MNHGISYLALAAAFCGAVSGAARAEDSSEAQPLGTMVLSALKTASEQLRSGVSVTVVTAEDLERAGDLHLGSYLGRLPGVSVAQTGPLGGATSLRIRGAEPRYVAVYIDGIRVDDPSGITSEFDFGSLLTADIGRVEVLRGSQSALWGGSAVGGVVNITSRAAVEDGLQQSAAIEAGSHDTALLRYGLTYRDDRIETTFTLSHGRSDGFSAYDTKPRDPRLEADGFEASRLSFSTRYRLSDALSLGVAAFAQKSNNDYDAFGADEALNRQERREFGARLFAELEAGATRHMFEMTRYRIARDDHSVDFMGELQDSSFTGTRLGFGYQGTTELSPALTLVYGADTMKETAVNAALPQGGSSRLSGAFAQGIWAPRDDLNLSLTLRQDHNSAFGDQGSGRFALAWQLSPELGLRASAATGFRAPSLYEQFGDSNWGIAPNPGNSPEESRSYELGADYQFGTLASFGVTLFRVDVENAITYCGAWTSECLGPIPAGFGNMYENLPGTSKRQGLELSGDVALNDATRLRLGYTYTDARKPSGEALARVPRHSIAVALEADLTPQLSGMVGVQRILGRPAEFGATADDYTLVNTAISYDLTETTEISLRIENLFDQDYQVVPDYGTSGRAAYIGLRTAF